MTDYANGPYAVTVTASDGTYSTSEAFGWTVTHTDTTALTMTNPGTQTDVAGDSVNLAINASDPDGIDTLTFTATNLPDGLNIDSLSGIISGTVGDDAVSNTPYQVTVTADDGNGQTVSQTFNWLINAAPITVQASPVSAVEGNDTGWITVATFTTADLNSQASDFTAVVNWGDGNSDTATVDGSNGSFTVTDDYVYAEKGSYAVSVTITDTITGASGTASNTATVTDAALRLSGGFELGAIQQQLATLTLATFTDGNSYAAPSDYTATIDWGDGSGSQPGTVGPNVDGVFSVQGTHTYSQDGTYTVTVSLIDADGNTATGTSTVAVGDLYAGEVSNLTVASFTDSDGNSQASAYTATIHWGDGTQGRGMVTGSNGTFSVQGSHTYAVDSLDQPGNVYQVSVSITDTDGDTLTGNGTVEVVRPPMSLAVGSVAATSGLTLSNVEVAAFTEPDTSDTASEFSAQINWGDGTPVDTTGAIVGSNGLFHVVGNHTYAESGTYAISVVVLQGWQGKAADTEGGAQAVGGQGNPYKLTLVPGRPVLGGKRLLAEVLFDPPIPKTNIVKLGEVQVIDSSTGKALPYTANPRTSLWPNAEPNAKALVLGVDLPSGLTYTYAHNPDREKAQVLLLPAKVEVKLVGATMKNGAGKVVPLNPTPLILTINPPNIAAPKQLDPIPVKAGGKQVGVLTVQYGTYTGQLHPYPAVAAVFNTAGKSASLQAAASAFATNGDHFNWYQVITAEGDLLYYKQGGAYFQLTVPYVDGPPGGYYYKTREGRYAFQRPSFDDLPWYYNDGKAGAEVRDISISKITSNSALGYIDTPSDPMPDVVSAETWLAVVDKDGKFIAWTGVGFSWTWTKRTGGRADYGAITNVAALAGQPKAGLLPSALFPPKPAPK